MQQLVKQKVKVQKMSLFTLIGMTLAAKVSYHVSTLQRGVLRWSCCLPGSGGSLKAGVRESATSATGRCEAHCGVVCGSSGLSFRSS